MSILETWILLCMEFYRRDFLNRRVIGCFNRISLAVVLRINHRRAMVEAGSLEANALVWMREVDNLDQNRSSDVVEVVRFWTHLIIKLSGFINRLDGKWERKRIENDSKFGV